MSKQVARIKTKKLPDGWQRVTGLTGWETHNVEVLTELVDGQPEVIGLRLIPLGHDVAAALTSSRLRGIPVTYVAAGTVNFAELLRDGKSVRQTLSAIAQGKGVEPNDPRSATTVEQVAEVYALALAAGLPPRAEVTKRIPISDRTADRYIAEARRQGLIPVYRKGKK